MGELIRKAQALRQRSNDLIVSFLQTDLEVAHTFYGLAKYTQDPDIFRKRVRTAQTAVETVSSYMWKVNLQPQELNELTAQIERLKFELENLGPATEI